MEVGKENLRRNALQEYLTFCNTLEDVIIELLSEYGSEDKITLKAINDRFNKKCEYPSTELGQAEHDAKSPMKLSLVKQGEDGSFRQRLEYIRVFMPRIF